MAKFEIKGHGRDSGRARKRIYSAFDKAEALEMAEANGTIVNTVHLLPDEPPTDSQLAYAKDLGISIPENVTKAEISDLISSHLEKDKFATERHRSFAKRYRVECTRFSGKRALFDRILDALKEPGREREIVSWYVFRVYRELVEGAENAPIQGPDDPIIQEIAEQLQNDQSVIKSIRRYEGRDLIWFGEWTAPDGRVFTGGSNNTIAYKRTSKLLRQKIRLSEKTKPVSPAKSKRPENLDRGTTISEKRSGLKLIIIIILIIAILVTVLLLLLKINA